MAELDGFLKMGRIMPSLIVAHDRRGNTRDRHVLLPIPDHMSLGMGSGPGKVYNDGIVIFAKGSWSLFRGTCVAHLLAEWSAGLGDHFPTAGNGRLQRLM
eukprot:gene17869-biopygen4291